MRRASLLLCLAGALFVAGFGQQPLPPGVAGHNESQDAFWDILASAPVTLDSKSGTYRVSFPEQVKGYDGSRLKITGFFLPIETGTKPRRFGLSRRNLSCPFCPPSKPTEVIEVVALEKITPVVNEMMIVEGKLKLVKDGEKGLFYRLEGAVVK
jgi:hypothetical protein